MNRVCEKLQDLVAAGGTEAIRTDEAAERHLSECTECFEFLEAFSELDSGLQELPRLDAPDAVVAGLLARPELATREPDRVASAGEAEVPGESGAWRSRALRALRRPVRPRFLAWGGAMAAALVLALFVANRPIVDRGFKEQVVTLPSSEEPEVLDALIRDREVERSEQRPAPAPLKPPAPRRKNAPTAPPEAAARETGQERERVKVTARKQLVDLESTETQARFDEKFISDLPVPERFYRNVLTLAPGVDAPRAEIDPNVHGSRDRDYAAVVGGVGNVDPLTGQSMSRVDPDSIEELGAISAGDGMEFGRAQGGFDRIAGRDAEEKNEDKKPASVASAPEERDARATARDFLAERAGVEGLKFRDASGYWSNSYIPGDPAFRLLQARLESTDRSALQRFAATPLVLHDAARPVGQPFDAPSDAALGVYLHADRRGIGEEGRLLVQVGLQATERRGGRRPAMNVALVLDMRGDVPAAAGAGIRALVTAFGQARAAGDRFSVVVAGRGGATVVEPRNFKHGFLSVTLDRLLSGSDAIDGPTLELADAVAMGLETVAAVDDPSSTLGSSAVVLITGQPLGPAAESIVDLAHVGAVAGVPLSVVAVGSEVALEQIDRVALAGQGNRRLLEHAAEASALVERELSAASRAVARAVRLRIRLAPGVKLVDVLGSNRLDEIRAERVRQAEQSIDRRMARNLGIEADRGEDEEGIQIVIPSFYAGDSHVILLDVTASGPGGIADVSVRYKDLVYLKNGVTRAGLSLGDDTRAAGPLERNVLKNFLSLRLSQKLQRAGRALAAGNPARAAALLNEMCDLLVGLRVELPDLDADLELAKDIRMLDEYAALLTSGATSVPGLRAQLSDSLRYAARVKLLPPTEMN